MKKLLLLAGAGPHLKVVESAKELGVYTVVTDYLEDSPAKRIADEAWMLDIMDVDAIVERCKAENIDGVLNFCIDPTQKPQQKICEKLNFPSFGNAEQYDIFTDKKLFKSTCLKYGVDVIHEYTSDDLENGKIKYPVLVKPAESRGSRGQTVCYDKQELQSAVAYAESVSSNGQAIIEDYMGGKPDFSLTFVVKEGTPYLVRTADRHLGSVESGMSRQTVASISPSRFTDMYMRNVHDRVVRFIKGVGIKNGPVLMQGFVDGDTIRFYDPGLRFPGNEYAGLFTEATGMNVMKSLIKFALGEGIDDYNGALADSCRLNGHRIFQLMYNIAPGQVAEVHGIDEVSQHPCVLNLQQRHFAGDIIEPTGDIRQRACEIDMLIDDWQMAEIIQYVQDTIKFIDVSGKDMYITPIDPKGMSDLYNIGNK